MMSLLSALKGSLIAFASNLTDLFEPYLPFTRLADVKDPSPLHDKAKRFQDLIDQFFHLRGKSIITYRVPLPEGTPMDLGDQALFHGIYTASHALEVALRPDAEKRLRLESYLNGLDSQQPGGILIRGIDDSGRQELNCSNDSATGHLLGLYFAYRYGGPSFDSSIALMIQAWARNIMQHGYALVNPDDGKPTTYGQLDQGWKSDPLRMSLLMAILLATSRITRSKESSEYFQAYSNLKRRYVAMVPWAKARFLAWDTFYDTHRAAIHLHILADLEPQEDLYKTGLRNLMNLARKQGNIWVLALCGRVLGYREGDRELALKVMSEFTVEDKRFNTGRHLSLDPGIPKVKYGGQWVAEQPVVKWRKTSQDFDWQRHPYALDARQDGEGPDSMHNGGDFLVAWRLGQLTGLFREDD